MTGTIRPPSPGLAAVVLLGLGQGVLGALRAVQWVEIGTDLLERGVVVVPLMGALAFARGLLVASIALLYAAFAWGALAGRGWAWWLGLVAAILNGLLVVNAMAGGSRLVEALPWAVVPAVVILYLLAPAGRQALRS
jgi:hypothetical protein